MSVSNTTQLLALLFLISASPIIFWYVTYGEITLSNEVFLIEHSSTTNLPLNKTKTAATEYFLNNGFSDGDTIFVCSGNFYDDGGAAGNYSNTDYTVTFCATEGNRIRADFNSFDINSGTGSLIVYNGIAPPYPSHLNLGSFNNTSSEQPNWPMVAADSCLTFRFIAGGTGSGWDVSLSCESACTNNLLINPSFDKDCDVCSTPDWQTNGISTQRRFWTKEADGAMAAWVTWGAMWQTVTSITSGNQYDLSFYACVHDPTHTQHVSLLAYDGDVVVDSVGVDINHDCDPDSTFAPYSLSLTPSTGVDSIRVVAASPGRGFPFKYMKVDRMCLQEIVPPPCELKITTIYSENCTGISSFTADWRIGIAGTNNGDNAISYQRNSELVQTHTLTGTTDTLTIANIPADGGIYDTLIVYFTNDSNCGDTVFVKRPVPCPSIVTGCASLTANEIAGVVYEDWNWDGIMNQHDTSGVQGIQVTAHDCENNLVGTTFTDINGNYIFEGLTSGAAYRIAFTLSESIACWAKPTNVGKDNGSDVQFVTAGNCANLGIANADDFCAFTTPSAIIPCYVGQAFDGVYKDSAAIVSFNLDWSGEIGDAGYNKPTLIATHNQVGAIYGVAYHLEKQFSYISAYYKRGTGYGPNGPGAIYQIDHFGGDITLFADINSIFSGNPAGTDTHDFTDDATTTSYDLASREAITKSSFGDIDLSKSGDTLFAINLKNKHLYLFPTTTIPTAANIDSIPLPQPAFCVPEDTRPFALGKDRAGNIYVGFVCGNEFGSTDGLEAYVYRWDGGNSFSNVLQFDLDFSKGLGSAGWEAWGNQGVFPFPTNRDDSPILADIEFDGLDMILGFRNRVGDQAYSPSSHVDGDIYRACFNGVSWTIENGGFCGGQVGVYTGTTATPSNPSGPGGGHYYDNETSIFGTQLSSGGLLSYDGLIVDVVTDPYNAKSAGIFYYDRPGQRIRGYEIYKTSSSSIEYNFGKINGLGDLEILCTATAPLEIGNYVWCDSIQNGIQDACEVGIDSIIIQLYDIAGDLVGQDTTTNSGQYYFNQKNVDTTGITVDGNGMATANSGNWTGMNYSSKYYIVFGNSQFAGGIFSIGSTTYNGVTTVAVNSNNNDNIDSDVDGNSLSTTVGAIPAGLPIICITTSSIGCGDHHYDMGLVCASYDWGDLPDTSATTNSLDYQTTTANNGPAHAIITGLMLGTSIDEETDGQASSNALGDGIDEDGLIIFRTLNIRHGGKIRLPFTYTNTSGDTAHVEAWIDWNGDGDFGEANEMVLDVNDGNGMNPITTPWEINIPTTAISGQFIGVRIRISHQDNMTPYGMISSGEVEDYLIRLDCETQICLPIEVDLKK